MFVFTGALATVISAALVIVVIAWAIAEYNRADKRDELAQDLSNVPHEIAVLDSPEWETS